MVSRSGSLERVATYYYETKCVTEVHRVFRRQLNVGRHGRVPSRNTMLAWVKKFEQTGSVFAMKHGAPRTVRTQLSDMLTTVH